MQQKITLVFIGFLLVGHMAHAQADTVLGRYKQHLLYTLQPEGDIKNLIATMGANGQWPDLDYADTEKANWKNLIHLRRLRDLALVWERHGSSWSRNPQVWKTLNAGLGHWLDKRYKNSNWWHNEIGVPQFMRDIIILVKKDLTTGQFEAALEVMAQHRVQENWVGANLTWSADLGFHYGALTGNRKLMELCRNLMVKEIRISREEGVQPDFSFHQHGARLQMYQYGAAFLKDNIRLAWELRGTDLAFPEEKIEILINFALQGWAWMARGIHTVPGTMDRSASRVDALNSADLRELVPYFIALRPEKKQAFNLLAQIQEGRGTLTGYRYYPYSDFAAFHQKDYSFFLKTISSRTRATEAINSENLKGNLLHSGDAYLINDGMEYFNLMPVWDWTRLPGVTAFNGANKVNRKQFTGAVTNGESGLTVMDYQLDGKAQESLTAHKFWASHGAVTVCLIANLQTGHINTPVYTTLDQSRLRGKVTVNSTGRVINAGEHELDHVKWIHHAGFAYIPISPSRIYLKIGEVSGSWKSISASLSSQTVTEKIFMPTLQHEVNPSSSAGYVLSRCAKPRDAQKLVTHPTWEVLRNDKDCQAVRFNDGTIMASFFAAGTLRVKGDEQLSADQPCLVLISDDKMYVSNPAHAKIAIALSWQGKVIPVVLKEDGTASIVALNSPH